MYYLCPPHAQPGVSAPTAALPRTLARRGKESRGNFVGAALIGAAALKFMQKNAVEIFTWGIFALNDYFCE